MWTELYPAVEQWRSLVSAYFPGDQVENALAIMQCESSGDPYAHNPGTAAVPEDSWGLFQVNLHAHPEMAGTVTDPESNVRYAAQLYAASGWSPWANCARIVGIGDGGPPGDGDGIIPGASIAGPVALIVGALLIYWLIR